MTKERYDQLMRGEVDLTREEMEVRWHFCGEFDGLLVGPGMPEMELCVCDFGPLGIGFVEE